MFLHHELKKVTPQVYAGILLFLGWLGGIAVKNRSKKVGGRSANTGVYVSKKAVPKPGTVLTPDRISEHFRSLNSGRISR